MNAINALVKNSFRKLPLSATVNQILNGKIGSEYVVSGWIRTIRKQKNFYFAEITDGSADSTLQLVIPTQLITERNQEIGLTHGSSIQLHGKLLESPAKGQVVEVLANEIVTIGPCSGDEYPIHKSEMSEAYLRNQALPFRLRTEKFARLVKLKSQISNHIHRVLTDNEFIQMFPPVITEHDCEGGGASFRLEASKPDFFSKPAYLSVSTQLHLEMAAASLPRVYSFSPVFRAENQQTTKHLSEFWMLECEMSFLNDFNALLSTIEMLIQSCCDDSMTINRITYTDAVKELQSASKLSHFEHPVYWGADLQTEHERFLAEVVFKGPVFVTDYPAELKPFYMKLNSDERTVACCDLLVPGVGEVVGGSLREDNYDALKRSMEQKLGTKHNLDWYLDLRKFGGTKHGGFGLGFDRLIQYISGTSNIRDVVMIPRFCGSIKY